jgi:hypothetical protein
VLDCGLLTLPLRLQLLLDLCVCNLLLVELAETLAKVLVLFVFEKRLIWVKLDVVVLRKLF